MPLDLDMVRAALPGREIVWFDVCGSTMTEAAKLARDGHPSGTVVIAEEQTAGQGRYRRAWHSEPGSGLYPSIVLRTAIPEESVGVLSMMLGLATAEAIARAADIRCDLRWPNDVLIGDRKCAGILVRMEPPALNGPAGQPGASPDFLTPAFIAGIGINVNHRAFPPELAAIATSLRLAAGRPLSREALLIHLLETVDSFTHMLAEGGTDPILGMFARASSYVAGKRVIVEQGGQVIEGVTEGLDASGFLYVRRPDGTRAVILAGGVRPAD
jgi:BirA family transcriptional regulator, biotin operon repressor / biotin---[acetyl-CoA-carboxylase] ligase